MTFALDGVRILCVAGQYPGPFATMVLADLGADVVLVERPQGGDPGRQFATFFDPLNRNKRSLAIDLKQEAGREAFKLAVAQADALIEGYRPGTMQRMGLDYEVLRQVNPRLIYASISGFGQTGPYRDRAAHDISYQSIAGNHFRHARSGRTEVYPEVASADLLSASFAAIGILSALVARERTGTGTYIDVSMTDSLVAANAILLAPVLNGALPPNIMAEPAYGFFECKDGKLISFSIAYEDTFWRSLCGVLDMGDAANLTRVQRVAQAGPLRKRIEAALRSQTREEWERRLDEADTMFAPVLDLDETIHDPQLLSRGLFCKIPGDPSGQNYVRQPLDFSAYRGEPTRPVPRLGQHTVEVLREAGMSRERIQTLIDAGAVLTADK